MRIVFPAAALLLLSACGFGSSGGAESSGEDGERAFELADFDTVSLRGPDNAEVTIGDSFSVRAEGDTGLLDDLDIDVRRGTLRIGRDSGGHFNWNGGDNGAVTVYVTLPALKEASVAGSGDMTVESAEADRFEGSIAGSGNLSIGRLAATSVEFDIAGSGNISAAGLAERIEINIAGSGNVAAEDLRAARLDVNIAGSGDIDAFATDRAEATLLGSGDVRVRGGASCSSNSLGSGELRCSE